MLFDEHRKGIRTKDIQINNKYYSDLKSKEPELVLKVASNIKNAKAHDVLDYISRNQNKNGEDEFLNVEDEQGIELDKEQLKKLADEWKEEFSKESENSRKMTHFVLSIDVKKTPKNEEKLKNATRDFLRERLGDNGFRYTFVVHNDTEHLHAHIVVNNNNLQTQKKLRVSKEWLQEARIMAKEHLQNHGIEQRATLKRDRQYFEKNIDAEVKASEREYKDITNWVEAKLKDSSRNSEHFQHIKKQYELLREAKQSLNDKKQYSKASQEHTELRNKINDLHKTMTLHKSFNSEGKSILMKEFRDVMKSAGIDKEMNQRVNEKRTNQQERTKSKQEYRLNQHARELVKTEFIIRDSASISKDMKHEMLAGIKERKKELTNLGVDMKHHQETFKKQMSSTEAYKKIDKPLSIIERTLEKNVRENAFDVAKAEKRLYRTLDEMHKTKATELSKLELEDIEKRKSALLKRHTELGLDGEKAYKKWENHRKAQDALNYIKSELASDKPLSQNKKKEFQTALFDISNNVENIALSKKELFSMKKSIETQQSKLDLVTGSKFSEYKDAIQRTNRNLTSLDKKIEDKNNILQDIEVKTYGGTPEQAKQAANDNIIKTTSDLVQSGQGKLITDASGRVSYQREDKIRSFEKLSPNAAFKKKMSNFDFEFDQKPNVQEQQPQVTNPQPEARKLSASAAFKKKMSNFDFEFDQSPEEKENKRLSELEVKAYGGTPEQAKQAANADLIKHWSDSVEQGRGEFISDKFGRVSYIDKSESQDTKLINKDKHELVQYQAVETNDIKSLQKDAENSKRLADRQAYAMTTSHIKTTVSINEDESLSPQQKQVLKQMLQRNELELKNRGVNIEDRQTRYAVTHEINKNLKYLEGIDMKNVRSVQFDVVQKAIDDTKQKLNDSDLNTTTKRDIKRDIDRKDVDLDANREMVKQTIEKRLKELEALSKQVEKLSKEKGLGPTAMLKNRREIEAISKNITTLSDGIKKDLPAFENTTERQAVKKAVEGYTKGITKSQSISR